MITKSRIQTGLLVLGMLALVNNVQALSPVRRIVNGQ